MPESTVSFRPRARLLQLLGDQLIRSHRLAVFELVKNGYDADATHVDVSLNHLNETNANIVVKDNGVGMSLKTVQDIWFVPGHDHKDVQRREKTRTPRGRLPLGEKGLGRFASHKLGNKIEMITRVVGGSEIVVEIDWTALLKSEFLSDAQVVIKERVPTYFHGKAHGTVIVITDLRETSWTRGEVRRLYRQLTSICSPFGGPDRFEVRLAVPQNRGWIEGLPTVDDIISRAIWKYVFSFDGSKFEWNYEFKAPVGIKVEGSTEKSAPDAKLLLPPSYLKEAGRGEDVVAAEATIKGIGPVLGTFYVFDRDRKVLERTPEPGMIKDYLDENGGVRVYRDGIRVYNYGEEDDDWLGLDLRRINTPTVKISRNIVIGAVELSLEHSSGPDGLVEKTNREGFVENSAFDRLRAVVTGALTVLETKRSIDKKAIRQFDALPRDVEVEKIRKPIEELRKLAAKEKLSDKFDPVIERLERDYNDMRETMLQAGLSGLGLATVFHEVQHGVRSLFNSLRAGRPVDTVLEQARELDQLLDGISSLLRKGPKQKTSIKLLLEKARDASLIRFRSHRVALDSPLIQGQQSDFQVNVPSQLFVGAITNLLDNAFYWLRVRWPARPPEGTETNRRIWIGRSDDFEDGPALVVADTGPGFEDDPENLVQPFFTRRPEGMGLGLYYVNLAMELSGAKLVFPDKGDVELPREYSGAIVAMVFPQK